MGRLTFKIFLFFVWATARADPGGIFQWKNCISIPVSFLSGLSRRNEEIHPDIIKPLKIMVYENNLATQGKVGKQTTKLGIHYSRDSIFKV